MEWIEGIIAGGALMILGIVKLMVMGKVSKAECDLKHTYLQTTVTDIKEDTKSIKEEIQCIRLVLAKQKGAASKSGLLVDSIVNK